MVNSGPILVSCLAGALFLLLNGPLWLSSRLRVFNRGPQAPHWLSNFTMRASRVVGVAGILLWLMFVSDGSILRAVLLGFILAGGAFLLWNGPLRLVTHMPFLAKGPEISSCFHTGLTWFNRVVGAGAVVSVLWLVW